MQTVTDTFFTRHCKLIQATASKQSNIPFKNHLQFPVISDILARKDRHHAALHADYFNQLAIPFLTALALYLQEAPLPRSLKNAQLIYLDIDDITITKAEQPGIDQDFDRLIQSIDVNDAYCIFITPALAWLTKSSKPGDHSFLHKHLKTLSSHPKCRMLALTNPRDFRQHQLHDSDLELVRLHALSETDTQAILFNHRQILESFHQISIPDAVLPLTRMLTERYITTTDSLSKARLILDSAAARASAVEPSDESIHLSASLTPDHLLAVVSAATQIPSSHLQFSSRQENELAQQLQQIIYGQEAALSQIKAATYRFYTDHHQSASPMAAFLFAGPAHTGKHSLAIALATHLYQQTNMLYFAQPPSSSLQTAGDIFLQPYRHHHFLTLREAIQQTPHAIIVFENIDSASPIVIEGLLDILTTGFLHDVGGQCHDFRHSLLILTTTTGSERLIEITKTTTATDQTHHADLMQLIMNERKHDELTIKPNYSPQELIREILPFIQKNLPTALCERLMLVPFLPLTKNAIEKMIRLKLNKLAKQIHAECDIEVSYAPEVIRYLVKEAVVEQERRSLTVNIDQIIKPMHFLIEQALKDLANSKTRFTQLLIQLNETGEILQYAWQLTTPVRQHAT